ncbi:hypothetical protein KBJ94_23525 [Pseudomonas sp. ITA]|uniref:hypothetical protein n=1 Tax=Pseudomonas sp. ITA TaxID=2825841 RepID=UPI0024992F68|nr:hypothetical protein [Pseudomonas sp. ITA]MDI2145024.1 hypothetical protein [Pseudomonas sp. ITA]
MQSIKWVDNAAHTIVMRAHPTKYGTRKEIQIPQPDGTVRSAYVSHGTYEFLVKDFLLQFEYEPDAEETARIHGTIQQLQSELIEAQSNPDILARVVEDQLRENTQAPNEPETAGGAMVLFDHSVHQEMSQLATGSIANALGSGITTEKVQAMKAVAEREYQVATIQSQWIQGKTAEITTVVRKLTPFFEEKAAASLAKTEDIRSYVAKLIEGIESLDLYVGKGVEVQTIRTGKPAAPSLPLSFVQKKLMMDEELAVWAEVDEEFDFTKEELFFDTLRIHDDLVSQIFPTERCVLVMATTRRDLDYGDRWTNEAKNGENRKVFLMVRNGENIYRVFSPVESHLGTGRLFPSRDDQDRIFRGVDGSQIKFEDVAYTTHLSSHDRFALHYKRFLLLMCGLDHREKLFGAFYPGPESLHFVSLDFQEKFCRFIHDDDGEGLIESTPRQSVAEWIKEKNAYLCSGSRVLCLWNELMNPDTAPSACKARGDYFDRAFKPSKPIDLKIAARIADSLCVKVEVTGGYGARARTFACNVNLTSFKRGTWSSGNLAFLCLDTVEPEELHWYIHNREARSNHIQFIRFFKLALAHIEQERESELDARNRMRQALSDGAIANGDEALGIISQTVIAWRAANRGKPLPQFVDGKAPAAWKGLLDQMYALAGNGVRQAQEIEAFVRQSGYTPLRIALTGNSKFVVYAAPKDNELDNRLEPHAWVNRMIVEQSKGKLVEKSRRWVILRQVDAAETSLKEWSEIKDWLRSSVFESYEMKQEILNEVVGHAGKLKQLLKEPDAASHRVLLENWFKCRSEMNEVSSTVASPNLAIPVGAYLYPSTRKVNYIGACITNPYGWLYTSAADNKIRDEMRRRFIRPFANKDYASSHHDQLISSKSTWCIGQLSAEHRHEAVKPVSSAYVRLMGNGSPDPRLATAYADWLRRDGRGCQIWFDEGCVDENGDLQLDALLGVSLPTDYDPRDVLEVHATSSDGKEVPYGRWFEIIPAGSDYTAIHRNVAGASGYSFTTSHCASPDEAREMVQSKARGAGVNVQPAEMIEGAPLPAEGCERWIILQRSPGNAPTTV